MQSRNMPWKMAGETGLQQLKIEAPAARSMAQETALRVAAIAAEKAKDLKDVEEERANSPRRGWDSTYGNPRFESESGEYDHLLLSPRNEKLTNNF